LELFSSWGWVGGEKIKSNNQKAELSPGVKKPRSLLTTSRERLVLRDGIQGWQLGPRTGLKNEPQAWGRSSSVLPSKDKTLSSNPSVSPPHKKKNPQKTDTHTC
jgi:hypothetical protein